MPSWSLMQKINGAPTNGLARKKDSWDIMEATWYEDIATQTCYFYDWYHDTNKTTLESLDSSNDENKVPMDVKFIVSSTQTYSKDAITYHLQLKPSQECVVPYYKEMFEEMYHSHYPIGLYVDIADSKGRFNRWLVVGEANYNDPQFPTYELLRCDYVFRYIIDGIKYTVPGVLRSQNSYNSGIWSDYLTQSVEDQQKFIVPINRETEKIYYNQRIIIDNKVLTQPRTWEVSKINRISPNGICHITLAQTEFNSNTDAVDEDGYWWADINASKIKSIDFDASLPVANIYSKIAYSGNKPEINVGGSYKTYTIKYFNNKQPDVFVPGGIWKLMLDGVDIINNPTLVTTKLTTDPSQLKIKFEGGRSYMRKVMTLSYTDPNGLEAAMDIEIRAL